MDSTSSDTKTTEHVSMWTSVLVYMDTWSSSKKQMKATVQYYVFLKNSAINRKTMTDSDKILKCRNNTPIIKYLLSRLPVKSGSCEK